MARASAATERTSKRVSSLIIGYYLVLAAVSLLLLLGLVMVFSASYATSIGKGQKPWAEFQNQAMYAVLGLIIAWIFSRISNARWLKLAWFGMVGAIILQLLVFIPGLGEEVYGNRNWIRIGQQTLQPSEFLKLALAVWIGAVLSVKRPLLNDWRHVVIPVPLVALVAIGSVLAGRDMGTAMIMIILVVGGMFIAGVPMRMFGVAAAVGVPVIILYVVNSSHMMARIDALVNPEHCDAQRECYQTLQSAYALANGGIFGQGLGASTAKWNWLTQADNDFIFAIIGEELGLAGTLLVLVLLSVLGIGLTMIVINHTDLFAKITTGAVTCWFLGQALINIGMVIRVLPVVGVPLPFVSYGGTALVACLAAIGVVASFVRNDPEAGAALRARPGAIKGIRSVLVRRTVAAQRKGA